ncbi:MAG: chromosome segregation protein SMC [Anaerolineae bacterium]
MRLKRLEILGYKSFANRTEILFDEGVTAVVGPNGSGKSNVADALRWVLGETNVRHLRGKKSDDLIFAGSSGRGQLGMAQVSLTLDNSAGWYRPPIEAARGRAKLADTVLAGAPAEVTITRRLYRDGSGEYWINGQRARLGDVYQLLAQGGVSGETYVVVGQGLVDQALSLRPDERRSMLDEAAGVKPLQAKRERALARLDETRANLLRVNDILSEITPQLRRLDRQASRAQEARRLSVELESLLVTWYGYQWGAAQTEVQTTAAVADEQRQAATEAEARLNEAIAHLDGVRVERDRQRSLLEGHRRHAGRLRDSADTLRRDLAVVEERARQLATRRAEAEAEAASLGETARLAAQRLAEAETAVAASHTAVETARAALREAQAALERLRAERQSQAAALDRARQSALKAAGVATDRRARARALAERLADVRRLLAESAAALEEHKATAQAARATYAARAEELRQASARLTEAEAVVAQARTALRDAEAGVRDARAQVEMARTRQREAAHRRAMLAQVRRADLGAAVQSILDHKTLTGIVGPLVQLMRVEPGLEGAVAAALGPWLHAVVVETWADAQRVVAHLADGRHNPVTLFVRQATHGGASSAPNSGAPPGSFDWLSRHVTPAPEMVAVAQAALGDVALADSVDHALALVSGAAPGCLRAVTRDGVVVAARGAITGGTTEGAEVLTREREWAALPEPALLEAVVSAAQETVAAAEARVGEARAALAQAEETGARRRQARDAAQGACNAAEVAVDRAASAEAWHTRNHRQQAEESERLTRQGASLEAEAAAADAEAAQADALLATLQATPLPDLTAAQMTLAQAQAGVAAADGARSAAAWQIEGARREHDGTQRVARERGQRVETLAAEAAASEKRLSDLRRELEQVEGERAKVRGVMEPIQANVAALEEEARKLEKGSAGQRNAAMAAERAASAAQAEAHAARERMQRLADEMSADLELLPPMPEDAPLQLRLGFEGQLSLPPVPQIPADLEERVRTLRAQLKRLGPADSDAMTEFNALSERHAFLTTQMADLEKAANDLRQVIAELDEAMATRFDDIFAQVARLFSRNFSLLFGGGTARLNLAEDGGLEINARPPGKRQQPLSLLSGGERALTASALVFALLEVSRTPFCMLDEVDAALDEANVGRFRAAVERLATRTQVILVTHNRGTVEAAQALYGITMNGQGISQAISLRTRDYFPDAKASDAAAD